MKKVLVAGSLAYDHLYRYPGAFKNQIAFNVIDKAVHFGGCAGNIVYNAALLKQKFELIGIAGRDFGDYERWLRSLGIATNHVIIDPDLYTSQAVVISDEGGRQMTFFHEGAASAAARYKSALLRSVRKIASGCAFAIIAPNSRDFVLQVASACQKSGLPYFFDPGQAMPIFAKQELEKLVRNSAGFFLNEYEFGMLQERLHKTAAHLIALSPLIVVTLAEKGSRIYLRGKEILIAPKKPRVIRDPTGCGDAYRAGFLMSILPHYGNLTSDILKEAGARGSELAAACLASVGTQNHGSVRRRRHASL